MAVDLDVLLADESLNAGAGKVSEAGGKECVDSIARTIFDMDFHGAILSVRKFVASFKFARYRRVGKPMFMSERNETIAYCHSCGSPMDVTTLAPFSNVECPVCGKHTRVKREFGPYTLVRRHALGGMSMVFVAQDNTLNREVALKILSEDFSADERRITAFEEEARITASFSHPHVVRVLTTGKAFDRFYIAMELVPGGHFEHQIRERGKIPEIEMLPLAIEVAQGLKAAHSAGLIHRDVKPGNILLDAEGHAKIVDFGLALVTHGGIAQATEVWATPYYVPPETIEGHPEDFRSDIYAFGATLYHALAGVPSCGQETMSTEILRDAKKKVVPLRVANPLLSADTCRIVERAMAYDPRDRFSSYDEMMAMLELALKRLKSGVTSPVETAGATARRRAKKKQGELLALAYAGLVLIGAVAGGIWWISRKNQTVRIVKPPVTGSIAPIIQESTNTASTDIAKSYREARDAVEAKDFSTAVARFAKLRENPEVQEPTRTWAGVEAVIAAYLDGQSSEAKNQALATSAHITTVPNDKRIDSVILETLENVVRLPVIPANALDASASDATHLRAWMLAGLKDWEQGMLIDASRYFSAVVAVKISSDDQWLEIYQHLARDYLTDNAALSATVFEKLPLDIAGCEAAVTKLEGIYVSLKTRGRARFNVRAWQLDIAKHAKLLAIRKNDSTDPVASGADLWDLVAIMAKLDLFARECQFTEAAGYLKSLTSDPQGAKRASLLSVAEASAVFLTDLKQDLVREAVTGDFPLKSGGSIQKISVDRTGVITTTDANGISRQSKWADLSADALIGLHRIFVRNPKSEQERLRRHECAISYDWLAGNRERALAAADALSQASPAFKQRWDKIASGLPK